MICICRVLGGRSSASDGFGRHLENGHGLTALLLNLGMVVRRRQALVLAAIDEATLAEMDPQRITEVRTRLNPLRRAWVALRTHRQVRRRAKRS